MELFFSVIAILLVMVGLGEFAIGNPINAIYFTLGAIFFELVVIVLLGIMKDTREV